MKFIHYPLSENLDTIVRELAKPDSILVFPTLSAAKKAQKDFLAKWDLSWRRFFSMEELRSALILPEQPLLTDDKRLLCLYLVMDESERQNFNIYSYSDVVDWGRRFFDFWEELGEECVSLEELQEKVNSGTFFMQEWQSIYLQKIITIRSNYYKYISALGFSDAIFCLKPANITVPWQGLNFYYINQYYYSALEKQQLKAIEKAGNNVTLVTHGWEIQGDLDNWKEQEFSLAESWNSLPQKPVIEMIETDNETQMALAFLSWNLEQTCQNCAVIDSSFHLKSYSHYFPAEHFAKPNNYSFCEGKIYKMLAAIYAGIQAVKASSGFLPLKILANFISEDWFCFYFYDESSNLEPAEYMEQLRLELSFLINRDYLYVDCAMFSTEKKQFLGLLVEEFYRLINAFSQVGRVAELCSLLDSPQGLLLDKLLEDNEKQLTDIIPVFWERMANFTATETLGLISSWQQIFTEESIGLNLLDLLLNFLKTAKISYSRKEILSPEWEISNLLDTRNRSFSTVVFLQMIEGKVPSSPTPVWLFNEAQRAKLGLKTFDDIRNWERYYFFRLLLCSERAVCFSYENQEFAIIPSSFLGELKDLLQNDETAKFQKRKVTVSLPEVYNFDLQCEPIPRLEDSEYCAVNKDMDDDFFIIPSDPVADFTTNNICFTASALIQFLKNPFLWYVENKSKIYLQNWEAAETISYKLFGNIMHTYFSTTLAELRGIHESWNCMEDLFGNSEKLEKQLKSVIASDKMKYQIPKNYNADFLGEILAKKLAQSLFFFYNDWLKKKVEGRRFKLIPETEEQTKEEKLCKPLSSFQLGNRDYILSLRGKADLRIELENKALIVDFKTGSHDYRQLCVYEWCYYLLDEVLPPDAVSSIFWNILDPTDRTEGVNEEKRNKLKQQILEKITDCLENGYSTITKTTDRQRLKNITRADLIGKKGGDT